MLNFPNLKQPLVGTILYVRIQNMFSYVNSSEINTTIVDLRTEFASGLIIYHYHLILSSCWKMWHVTDLICSEAKTDRRYPRSTELYFFLSKNLLLKAPGFPGIDYYWWNVPFIWFTKKPVAPGSLFFVVTYSRMELFWSSWVLGCF